MEAYLSRGCLQKLFLGGGLLKREALFVDLWYVISEVTKYSIGKLGFFANKALHFIILGNCTIQAADCSKKQFNSHEKVEMTFKEFLQYWKAFPDGINSFSSLLFCN